VLAKKIEFVVVRIIKMVARVRCDDLFTCKLSALKQHYGGKKWRAFGIKGGKKWVAEIARIIAFFIVSVDESTKSVSTMCIAVG